MIRRDSAEVRDFLSAKFLNIRSFLLEIKGGVEALNWPYPYFHHEREGSRRKSARQLSGKNVRLYV